MKKPTNPRGILLDLDGTLADSLTVMRFAYRMFLNDLQRQPSDAEFDSLNGPPLSEVIRRLKISHSIHEDEDLLLSKYFELIDSAYSKVKPSLGATDLLKKAREHDCVVGIVTSNTRSRTQAWLENVSLSDMIDFIVSGDEVKRGKPHSEPYTAAISNTSYMPRDLVAFEDSPQGATSSISAGLTTYVLGYEKSHHWPLGVEPIPSLAHMAARLWRSFE